MSASGPNDRAGARLKQLRERLDLTLREVEALSKQLAIKKENPDFVISRGWLNNVENGTYTPGVYKLYSPFLVSLLGSLGLANMGDRRLGASRGIPHNLLKRRVLTFCVAF